MQTLPFVMTRDARGKVLKSRNADTRFVEQVRNTLTRTGANPFQYQVVAGTREHRRAPGRQCLPTLFRAASWTCGRSVHKSGPI